MPKKLLMDDRKLKVLETLKALHHQTPRRYWFTIQDIAEAAHQTHAGIKETVYAMCADGWISLRDGDNDRQIILIQLREEYR